MGLFGRSHDATVTVSPSAVTPRQSVHATVGTDGVITKVRTAQLDWGYTNFFRYHWAGRADSAAAAANDTLWMAGQVGTNYGGERDTDEWVSVTQVDLPVANGEFTAAQASFTVPSWAPGSSDQLARWSCRLRIDRDGRDVDARADFTVLRGTAGADVDDVAQQRITGDETTRVELDLASPVWRAGDVVHGRVTLLPQSDLPDGDLAVYWQRHRDSHPLTRSPAAGGALDGPILPLGKRIPLRARVPVTIPFALPLPPDAAPSGTAVHSSLRWFVGARMFYAGFSGNMTERVRRPIVVVNAP